MDNGGINYIQILDNPYDPALWYPEYGSWALDKRKKT